MSFRIGQRVRVVSILAPGQSKYIGAIGTIVSTPYTSGEFFGQGPLTVQDVRWEENAHEWNGRIGHGEPVKCLAPIDPDPAFERFMERVLKPLPQPALEAT